jgi:hypothetical protein
MRWAVGLSLVFLAGCTREVFDHTPGPRADGGTDAAVDSGLAEIDCQTAEPGTRCDDDNICTPASTCRDDGECRAGTTSRECLVAGTSDRAMDTQGDSGWYYGFWSVDQDDDDFYDPDSDFEPMDYCDDGNWRRPGMCEVDREDPSYRWTSVLSHSLQHPETNPDLELPIRRWVSTVSGPARLVVDHHVSGDFGDGTTAILLLDGDELWRHDAIAGDMVGTMASFDVQLEVGTLIEQLVHPIVSSSDDTTYFDLRVEGR